MNKLFISILLLLLFFVSGIKKILTFSTTVGSFINKNFSANVANIAIIIAIIIEIFAPLIIWYELYTKKQVYSNYAIISLIIFTALATFIYHPNDIPGTLKNVSIIGGLFLLM